MIASILHPQCNFLTSCYTSLLDLPALYNISVTIMKSALLMTTLAPSVLALPPTRVKPRSTTVCGQWDSVATGSYTVYQDLWGEDSGTGSQCSTVDGLSGSDLSWSTSWSWSGGSSDVKSYANAVTDITVAQLSSISSIPTTWDWR